MALIRNKAKKGLKPGGVRQQQGARGLGCHVKLGVLCIRRQAIITPTCLGDRGQIDLICFFRVAIRFTWSFIFYARKPDGRKMGTLFFFFFFFHPIYYLRPSVLSPS